MSATVLVIGHNSGLLDALARIGTGGARVCLLVEPSVAAAYPGAFEHPVVAEIRTSRYIFDDEAVEVGLAWHAEVGFDAVLPGKEFGVRAAAAIAAAAGLGYPGDTAVAACTDKLVFRRLLAQAGFPTPRFRPVTGPGEVADFVRDGGGRAVVLKPRNRNGSLGVRYIGAAGEVDRAWAESVGADEGLYKPVDRDIAVWFTYLAEQYLAGPEFSVELLVAGGEVVFTNITEKAVGRLPWFPEMRHRVPAVVPGPLGAALTASGRRLAAALAVDSGLLHSEWRVDQGRVYPLECALRFPGDRIAWLIELAYGINLAEQWLRCLGGIPTAVTAVARRHAATVFLDTAPGAVVAVHGAERFAATHHPHELSLPHVGDRLGEARDSHSRAGFTVVDGDDRGAVDAAIRDFTTVTVETRP